MTEVSIRKNIPLGSKLRPSINHQHKKLPDKFLGLILINIISKRKLTLQQAFFKWYSKRNNSQMKHIIKNTLINRPICIQTFFYRLKDLVQRNHALEQKKNQQTVLIQNIFQINLQSQKRQMLLTQQKSVQYISVDSQQKIIIPQSLTNGIEQKTSQPNTNINGQFDTRLQILEEKCKQLKIRTLINILDKVRKSLQKKLAIYQIKLQAQ